MWQEGKTLSGPLHSRDRTPFCGVMKGSRSKFSGPSILPPPQSMCASSNFLPCPHAITPGGHCRRRPPSPPRASPHPGFLHFPSPVVSAAREEGEGTSRAVPRTSIPPTDRRLRRRRVTLRCLSSDRSMEECGGGQPLKSEGLAAGEPPTPPPGSCSEHAAGVGGRRHNVGSQNHQDSPLQHYYSRRLPDFLQSVKLKYVKLGYHYLITHLLTLLLVPLMVVILLEAGRTSPDDLHKLWLGLQYNLVAVLVCSAFLVFGTTVYCMSRSRPIYLVDYACYRAPDHLRASRSKIVKHSRLCGAFSDSVQYKILERSGLGDETYLPEAIHQVPPRPSMAAAREEAEMVMFGALDILFRNTGVRPKDIGVLVVNCSLFNPTPSLSAMIINKYKLRGNIRSFNLGGMGCSAGVIAIDLAKDLLQVHGGTYAVVVSTENITQNLFFGNRKSMLIPNCLFRVGGAAVLLSNHVADRRRAKYRLVHVVRTHRGADDMAFRCVFQEQDDTDKVGVSLSKDLMAIAGVALKTNITTLGPLVLPISEQLLFFATLVVKKLFNDKVKPYIPDFKLAFEHFCIHAGGRAVIDELEKNLQLRPIHVEASRMTLHRFGNTSSSSIWYELSYIEAKGRIQNGHRIWQIAFGSGFKCNSAVWQALRTVKPSPNNPWHDCIHRYPVELVDGLSHLDHQKQEQ
ncbi:hypothetical protein Taro_030294 [Colocasia esculenta]|uniref:very-long-chain 3-oxoacyl-CoA synthase n=1 Tax=Colocasia esculenta TaxID=4460 RepID=A0A843VVR5_COLES|nr:hypothetical protein [Colocasia esculenta]